MFHEHPEFFYLFGIIFWPVTGLLGRRAMRHRVAIGLVDQSEVNGFTRGFVLILTSLWLVTAAAYFARGDLGARLSGGIAAVACVGFMFWLWRANGAEKLVLFGPFLNMPLKHPKRVRLVATALFGAAAVGNLLGAVGLW